MWLEQDLCYPGAIFTNWCLKRADGSSEVKFHFVSSCPEASEFAWFGWGAAGRPLTLQLHLSSNNQMEI